MPYDPTIQAVVDGMLQCLAPDADMAMNYVDKLRQLAYTIHHVLLDPDAHQPTPEQEQQMRQGLGVLDPRAGDAALPYLTVLQRCGLAVDRELFRWDASPVQPRGWSGASVVPVGGGQFEPHT